MKKPVVIGIMNFLLPGLGYLVLGKKKTFGTLVLIGGIAGWIWAVTTTLPHEEDSVVAIIAALFTLFFQIAFAYDGYTLAKEEQPSV